MGPTNAPNASPQTTVASTHSLALVRPRPVVVVVAVVGVTVVVVVVRVKVKVRKEPTRRGLTTDGPARRLVPRPSGPSCRNRRLPPTNYLQSTRMRLARLATHLLWSLAWPHRPVC